MLCPCATHLILVTSQETILHCVVVLDGLNKKSNKLSVTADDTTRW